MAHMRPAPTRPHGGFSAPAGAPSPRPNRIGQFGMVSLASLEQIAAHVEPVTGLHVWTAQALYVALAGCASQQGTANTAEGQRCRVTVGELAARTRMGRRNVQRYLSVLEDAGVVRVVHRHDALHRPVASDFLFLYPGHTGQGVATPESPTRAASVADGAGAGAVPPVDRDSGVATVSQKEESERGTLEPFAHASRGREDGADEATLVTHGQPPGDGARPASPARERWERARAAVAAGISAAASLAWLATLEVAEEEPGQAPEGPPGAPGAGGASARALVLTCGSPLQRDLVDRRYRKAIEAALDGPVVLLVRPAGAQAGSQDGGRPDGATRPPQGR